MTPRWADPTSRKPQPSRGPSALWVAACFLLASLLLPCGASAQCGATRSTCSGCHDPAGAAPPAPGPWHDDHRFADLCSGCHGGRPDAAQAGEAHQGLVGPLDDEGARCSGCHSPSAPLAGRYREKLSSMAVGQRAEGQQGLGVVPHGTTYPHGEPGPNLALSLLIGSIGLAGGAFVARNEAARKGDGRRRHHDPAARKKPS